MAAEQYQCYDASRNRVAIEAAVPVISVDIPQRDVQGLGGKERAAIRPALPVRWAKQWQDLARRERRTQQRLGPHDRALPVLPGRVRMVLPPMARDALVSVERGDRGGTIVRNARLQVHAQQEKRGALVQRFEKRQGLVG